MTTLPGSPPPDVIRLNGLRLVGVVGVLPEERERAQPLDVSIELHVDLSAAGVNDSLTETVDYGAVCDSVAETVASAEPELLERLALLISEAVLALDERVEAVTVSVDKLRPPVPHDLGTSGVRITRRRPGVDEEQRG